MCRHIFFFLFFTIDVLAIGPHEILLIVNGNSSESVEIGKWYAAARHVPPSNVVTVQVPREFTLEISRQAFTDTIWVPACAEVDKRGIKSNILAWVYSVGFPLSITTDPPISITGITFTKNNLPSCKSIRDGTFKSALYTGFDTPLAIVPLDNPVSTASHSLDFYSEWLADEMPLPSMILGHAGQFGNSIQKIKKYLQKGISSDGTRPTGEVWFVVSNDVRSHCRSWQYSYVQRELKNLGIRAYISSSFPPPETKIVGLMMGGAEIKPPENIIYLHGCVAEHLTSEAAKFDSSAQTKLTAWLDAGAVASAGTVSEPFANWRKFPSAFFFCHYVSGCTIIESFYQSVYSPLQVLFVGDPLAAPWAPRGRVDINIQKEEGEKEEIIVRIDVSDIDNSYYGRVVLYIDEKKVGNGREHKIKTTSYKGGKHRIRAVAYRTNMVRTQLFCEKEIEFVSIKEGKNEKE